MRGYDILRRHGVPTDILCVVSAYNVRRPAEVYGFFREIGASYVTFLPLVERRPDAPGGVSPDTVPSEAWGDFLCAVFDEWVARDIGRIKIQIVEEAARTAFGQEHSLCIFRPVCGDIPVLERNGDFYSCDHFVDAAHRVGNIRETPLVDLIEDPAQRAFGLAKLEKLPPRLPGLRRPGHVQRGVPEEPVRARAGRRAGAELSMRGLQEVLHPCPAVRRRSGRRMAPAES